MKRSVPFFCLQILLLSFGCSNRVPEMTLEEIESYRASSQNAIVEKTVSKPYNNEAWVKGKIGGVWNTTISADPKSFNLLIAEHDGATHSILLPLTDYLFEYDPIKKEWKERIASFKISVDEEKDTMDVLCTLRDDLYWSFYKDSKPKVKVTSDDVIFWYDEIFGDEEVGSSAYSSQFVTLDDGELARITVEKIDDLSFVFHFPRLIAEPILFLNTNFGPAFIYSKAKKEGGVKAIQELFSVASDPKEIPSMGRYFITEYTPGQRLVYERNADCWEKDIDGVSYPYYEKCVAQIVSDSNTSFLMFRQGKFESFAPTPEQLEALVNDSEKGGYTVFNAGGSLSAPFWSFNQNPKNSSKPFYKWFCKKEFRQAMSCLLNRERIITEVYRGLAEPKYSFFPEPNTFYNENIILKYRYSHAHAQKLLSEAGFKKKEDGVLYDEDGNPVEFDLAITAGSTTYNDMAMIVAEECKKEGITVRVRPLDFQKLVDELFSSFEWQSVMIGFSGSNIFPSQGGNVWPSNGQLHLWHPAQKTPATKWEERVDYLYNEASCKVDVEEARPLWEEYQEILLDECPLIYLVRGKSFFAINNRWDFSNFYFDNMNGACTEQLFLKEP